VYSSIFYVASIYYFVGFDGHLFFYVGTTSRSKNVIITTHRQKAFVNILRCQASIDRSLKIKAGAPALPTLSYVESTLILSYFPSLHFLSAPLYSWQKITKVIFCQGQHFLLALLLVNLFFWTLQRDVPELYIQPTGTITGTTLNELFVETTF